MQTARSAAIPLSMLAMLLFPAFLAAQVPGSDPVYPAEAKAQAGAAAAAGAPARTADRLDLALEHRTRYETLSNRFRLGESGGDQQLAQRTRLRIGINKILDPIGLLFEFEDGRVHLTDAGSTVTSSHENENDILQLYATVRLSSSASVARLSTLRIGRQSFDLGSRRLFARNRYRNTTNAFDGFRYSLNEGKSFTLDAFVFQPVLRRMHQLDTREHGSYFWGAYFATARLQQARTELYYFGMRESPTAAQSQKRKLSTFGTRVYRDSHVGGAGFEFEATLQAGKKGEQDHFAHFEHISIDYTFNRSWRPKVTGRYDYASGDSDPDDARSGAFDTLFGARRWEYGPTGIYGAWSRSNLSSPGWALDVAPLKPVSFSAAMRWIWLAQARDQWAGTRLRDVSGSSGTYLGSQVEFRLRCNASAYFTPELGYVHLFKGAFPDSVPGSPRTANSDYFYVEANFVFSRLLR